MVTRKRKRAQLHPIRIGVGGWSFAPWNQTFYPPKLPARSQLEYMSHRMTAVEVNATFYSTFKPATFARWHDETPENFVFSLKAHRFSTTRKTRPEMKKSIAVVLGQGLTLLKSKLGPINWQFSPARKFDAEYFDAFLSLLPAEKDGVRLRHAVEVRGTGFDTPQFSDLLARYGVAAVWADSEDYPQIGFQTADFAVARIMRSRSDLKQGYTRKDLNAYAATLRTWATTQDVFAFFISAAKERNPAAAEALLRILQDNTAPAPPADP